MYNALFILLLPLFIYGNTYKQVKLNSTDLYLISYGRTVADKRKVPETSLETKKNPENDENFHPSRMHSLMKKMQQQHSFKKERTGSTENFISETLGTFCLQNKHCLRGEFCKKKICTSVDSALTDSNTELNLPMQPNPDPKSWKCVNSLNSLDPNVNCFAGENCNMHEAERTLNKYGRCELVVNCSREMCDHCFHCDVDNVCHKKPDKDFKRCLEKKKILKDKRHQSESNYCNLVRTNSSFRNNLTHWEFCNNSEVRNFQEKGIFMEVRCILGRRETDTICICSINRQLCQNEIDQPTAVRPGFSQKDNFLYTDLTKLGKDYQEEITIGYPGRPNEDGSSSTSVSAETSGNNENPNTVSTSLSVETGNPGRPSSGNSGSSSIEIETEDPRRPNPASNTIEIETGSPGRPNTASSSIEIETGNPGRPNQDDNTIEIETGNPGRPNTASSSIEIETGNPGRPNSDGNTIEIETETGNPGRPNTASSSIEIETGNPGRPNPGGNTIEIETGNPGRPNTGSSSIEIETGNPGRPDNEENEIVIEVDNTGGSSNVPGNPGRPLETECDSCTFGNMPGRPDWRIPVISARPTTWYPILPTEESVSVEIYPMPTFPAPTFPDEVSISVESPEGLPGNERWPPGAPFGPSGITGEIVPRPQGPFNSVQMNPWSIMGNPTGSGGGTSGISNPWAVNGNNGNIPGNSGVANPWQVGGNNGNIPGNSGIPNPWQVGGNNANPWQVGGNNGNIPGTSGIANPWQVGGNNGNIPGISGIANPWQVGGNNGNIPGNSGIANPWQVGGNNGNIPGVSGGANPWQVEGNNGNNGNIWGTDGNNGFNPGFDNGASGLPGNNIDVSVEVARQNDYSTIIFQTQNKTDSSAKLGDTSLSENEGKIFCNHEQILIYKGWQFCSTQLALRMHVKQRACFRDRSNVQQKDKNNPVSTQYQLSLAHIRHNANHVVCLCNCYKN